MKQLFITFTLFIIMASMAVGCNNATPESKEPPQDESHEESSVEKPAETEDESPADDAADLDKEKVLRIALTSQLNSFDLPYTLERTLRNVTWAIYDSLVWVDEQGNVVPALAKDWEISEDGITYTFHLRDDITFHNGELFNADSVLLTWQRGLNEEAGNKKSFQLVTDIEKVDDYTVNITTDGPSPLLLDTMSTYWGMVPPKYIAEVGDEEFGRKPIGTGPFMYEEWVTGERIVLMKNPNYFREGYPKLDKVIFRTISESATRVAAIQTGEMDIVTRLSADEADSLRDKDGVEVMKYSIDRVYYITFNNLTSGKGLPTENVNVRLAMNYAVDMDTIIERLFNGHAIPATGFITANNFGHDASIKPYGYDPDKARELLTEAGYPDGFDIGMACPIGAYTSFDDVCQAIQGYLGEVGINADLELMETGKYWDLESKKELPPLFGESWSNSASESLIRLEGLLRADATYSTWTEPTIDDLLDKITMTAKPEDRAELYKELQQYMHDNPPFIYLYVPSTFEAIRNNVKDYTPRAAENYFLYETIVE
ncbi:MAG: hypothetical protein B6242_06070 [Anaerolineaceae bacterium 4572_78]|nr:MAG: hypothetical protein B6242_06070 [Anaerolineaceae bacterium 4572_78]